MTDRKYLIGVDIGTQGTKTVVFSENGYTAASDYEPSRLIYPSPGAVEEEPDKIYGSVLRTIRNAIEKSGIDPRSVAAVGMDGQMAGIMGVDSKMHAVTPLDSWLDTRCEPYIDKMKAQADDAVTEITGCPVTYAHGPKILRWKYEFPSVYARIDKFIEPVTYAVCRICGLDSSHAYIDYTNIHFSGFADNQRLDWSNELISGFKIDGSKLPPIVSPSRVIGGISKEAADFTGLISGTPVIAGCGDQAATSLGAGITSAGMCFDGAGTASVFSCCTDVYKPDTSHRTLLFPRHVIDGLWQPMAYISGGGLCLRWFRDSVLSGVYPYAELEKGALGVPPGCDGLYFIPHFSGRTCPSDPNVSGMFHGLKYSHDRYAMFRSVMESIAFEYGMYLDILRENGAAVRTDVVYGTGGGSASPIFDRIKADVLNVRYAVTERNDTAPFGSALLAGHGVGLYPDLKAAADSFTNITRTYEPDAKLHERYAPFVAGYRKLLNACGELGKALS